MSTALHSPDDLAAMFGAGTTARWVLDQARENGWPTIKIGRRIWFSDEHVTAILAKHTVRPDARPRTAVVIEGQTARSARRSA